MICPRKTRYAESPCTISTSAFLTHGFKSSDIRDISRFNDPDHRPLITLQLLNMANEILTSLLGALQASLSVLLVILYGVLAAQFDILQGDSTKQISTLCVRMFLPALLITKVGSQLHADTGIRYVPILSKLEDCAFIA